LVVRLVVLLVVLVRLLLVVVVTAAAAARLGRAPHVRQVVLDEHQQQDYGRHVRFEKLARHDERDQYENGV